MADLILALHALYVLGIAAPIPLILLGAWRGWRFVRNRWFRRVHLAMIGVVVLETLLRVACLLTGLEAWFRGRVTPDISSQGFLARWISRWLYYNWPPAAFTALYLAAAALVVILYLLVPPAARGECKCRRQGQNPSMSYVIRVHYDFMLSFF